MPCLILASTSPYRRAQLEQLGVPFDQHNPGVDEDHWKQIIADPKELALKLAEVKAEAVAHQLAPKTDEPQATQGQPHDAVIIAGDQVAAIDGIQLDKPGSLEGTIAQLKQLAGRTHYLHSAIAVYDAASHTLYSQVITHDMTMRPLSDAQIQRYAAADEPFDCVGSYRIEARGVALFSSISGHDHSAIVGLPLMTLTDFLLQCGVEVL